ncbi:hypothetical protein GCM10012275_38460 [Longimycelium tulufanense]|uniref:Uncharacterized protein n=1 Tax=Longimycelium tulufanense TaxID=907463 RepID=A0A8J3CGJ1_9PSEU|nr:hypothetical protein [Longimycelium tulufanense]GGM64221.1 hypothetical protein GCM10012275_38460 [Longimycelium tulufanense]
MTRFITYVCDRHFRYGTCNTRTVPTRDAEQAARDAQANGWLLGRDRDYCPHCRGHKPRTGERHIRP